MARVTPEEYTAKHARRTKAASEDMRAGISRVTESPMMKAAAKKDKMLTNLTAAVNEGKWERGLGRVSLEEWKEKMMTVGVQRVSAGIDASAMKVQAFAAEFLPFQDRVTAHVRSMPDITLEDNIARSAEQQRRTAAFKRSR